MDDILKEPMSRFPKELHPKDESTLIALNGGINVQIPLQALYAFLGTKFIPQAEKNKINGVPTLDENGKIRKIQLPDFDFNLQIQPIDLNSDAPTQSGVFEPLEEGVYANFGNIEITEEELTNGITYIYYYDNKFVKSTKTIATNGNIEPNNNNAVSGDKVYNWSVRNVKNIAELRTIQGTEGQKINLLGYYEAGDKPALLYKWVNEVGEDDGGSVINSTGGRWEALFGEEVQTRDFEDPKKAIQFATNKRIKVRLFTDIEYKNTTNELEEIEIYKIEGRNHTIVLDGILTLKSKHEEIEVENLIIKVKNYFGTVDNIIEFDKRKYVITKETEGKSVFTNLVFNAEVSKDDGSERGYGCIRDTTNDININNIKADNFQAVVVLDDSRNININNVEAKNNGTTIILNNHGTAIVKNIKLINTPLQAANWINKNNGRGSNGQDTILCSGNDIIMENISAINPVERTVYCQSSNVVANNLYCLNGDGFKFVGIRNEGKVNKNIFVSNSLLEVDETYNSTISYANIGLHQIYLTENITLLNSKSVSVSGAQIGYCVRTSEYCKNLIISGFDVHSRQPLLYVTTNIDSVSPIPYEVSNIKIDNNKITLNNTGSWYEGALLHIHGHTSSDNTVYITDITITKNFIEYTEEASKAHFMYDFRNCENLYGKDNIANTVGSSNDGLFNTFRDIKGRNVEVFERVKVTSINSSFPKIKRYIFKTCQIEFEHLNHKMNYICQQNTNTDINITTTKGYFQIDIPENSAVVDVDYKSKKYIGGLEDDIKTDILGADELNLVRYSNNKIEVRGDLNAIIKYVAKINIL